MKNFDDRLTKRLKNTRIVIDWLGEGFTTEPEPYIDELLSEIKAEIAAHMPKEKEEFLGGFPAQAYNQAIQDFSEALQLEGKDK